MKSSSVSPDSVITNVKIVSEGAPASRFRIRIKIGVAYGTDIEEVKEILMRPVLSFRFHNGTYTYSSPRKMWKTKSERSMA